MLNNFFLSDIKEDTLREHFGKCGEIEDIRVIRDKATGIGKGFAYIHFQVSLYKGLKGT